MIDHVNAYALHARDLRRCVAFYRDKLGFTLKNIQAVLCEIAGMITVPATSLKRLWTVAIIRRFTANSTRVCAGSTCQVVVLLGVAVSVVVMNGLFTRNNHY